MQYLNLTNFDKLLSSETISEKLKLEIQNLVNELQDRRIQINELREDSSYWQNQYSLLANIKQSTDV